jgi:hypothetical protein
VPLDAGIAIAKLLAAAALSDNFDISHAFTWYLSFH